jgi:hypothetical protein
MIKVICCEVHNATSFSVKDSIVHHDVLSMLVPLSLPRYAYVHHHRLSSVTCLNWSLVCYCSCRWHETVSEVRPTVHPPDDISGEWNDTNRKTKELKERPVPVPLCPQQIPHGLT